MQRAIYGAGQFSRYFFKVIESTGGVDFFIDAYTQEREMFDRPIYRPDNAPMAQVFNSVHFYDEEIVLTLRRRGYEVKSFMQTLEVFPEILKIIQSDGYFWLDNFEKMCDPKMEEVANLFQERESRRLFAQISSFRKSLQIRDYPYPNATLQEQYFPKTLSMLNRDDGLRFVDCGAYIGDTIEALSKRWDGQGVAQAVSFEPDPRNLSRLQQNLLRYENIQTVVVPMGVYSQTTTLRLSCQGSSSSVGEVGEVAVPVTSLDETLYAFKPNYIKMDIEGAEKEAILGAKQIIETFSPNLAIALYHRPSDLWEIPLLIHAINPSYDFFLRVHAHMGIETVLYCKQRGSR